jgi:hypothetical protein
MNLSMSSLLPEDATAKSPESRSGPTANLSDDERQKLARIRRNRNQGWMPTFEEFDFLLEVTERMAR